MAPRNIQAHANFLEAPTVDNKFEAVATTGLVSDREITKYVRETSD